MLKREPHDPLVCGLDHDTDCEMCFAYRMSLEKPMRPCPQPCNNVAGSFEEQGKRAIGEDGWNYLRRFFI